MYESPGIHTFEDIQLTEILKALKDSVLIDQYMGWSHAGNTRQKYQHYYNDDSFDAMLTMMDGLKPSGAVRARQESSQAPGYVQTAQRLTSQSPNSVSNARLFCHLTPTMRVYKMPKTSKNGLRN